MSVDLPKLTITLGVVGIPQADVITALVYLGATKEVSSWELKLQNWNGKYSPKGLYPLNVGQDGYLCIGRGVNVPQLITTRTESVKFESSPTENYVTVSGRCGGEKLFRYSVTKDYCGYKGEAIVKNLLDYYAGISHVRNGAELVADTDTSFTDLKVSDTQTWDLLQRVASESDRAGVIGYDFRTTPDGMFEFFPRGTKTSPVNLVDRIEQSVYSKEITAVRNKVTIYGAADKSAPLNKVNWTQSLTPVDGNWTSTAGEISLEAAMGSPFCIKLHVQDSYFGGALFTFNTGHLINANLYPELHFSAQKETYLGDRSQIVLFDNFDRSASRAFTFQSPGDGGIPDQWASETFKVGSLNASDWSVNSGFDWSQIWRVALNCYPVQVTGSGSFWIDKLFFGGLRYCSTHQDLASQGSYGLREYVDTDEELWSDNECSLRARATLASMKDPAESLTIKSTVIDYGTTPILAGDTIHVNLPNENVDADFRVLSVEYSVDGAAQTLEVTLELGRQKPLLADYVYALRSKTSALSRYKVAKG